MADVTLSYKGDDILELSDSGSATLKTGGTYCEADIEVEYVKPSGGGGSQTTVASGTFTGNGSDAIDVFVGKKMPNGYFLFRVWVADGTEFIRDTTFKVIAVQWATLRANAFDFSTDGLKTQTASLSVVEDNNGTKTTIVARADTQVFSYLRAGSTGQTAASNSGYNRITKDGNGFTINLNIRNPNYLFVSGLTYNFEVIYYGSDPTNEIVEVA